MASSVSSERAFSQGGITVSKRRNCLKGDIVEALQCVKCAIRNDLLFRDAAPSSHLEAEFDVESDDEPEIVQPGLEREEPGWDDLLIDIDDPDDDSVL